MPSYATRTISFQCELFHAPSKPDPGLIQKVHNELFAQGTPPYSSFAVTPVGPVLSNPAARPGIVSQAAFLADRFQFREEMGGMTPEDFGAIVHQLSARVVELKPIEAFIGMQVTIRSLVNPRTYADSRDLLRSGIFGFSNELQTFGQDPQIMGLRLVFPPHEDRQHAHVLRIETYAQDVRSLFIENQSTFGHLELDEGLERVEDHVAAAYDFLTQRALGFVGQFDR